MRESGILLPIFSLPSKFGVGSLGEEALKFVDFLEKSGQGFWQVLPLGPTGYGNSPYQPASAFAGNPYFISPEELIKEGLLTWDECNACDFGSDQERVDYGALYFNRNTLLKKAHDRFKEKVKTDSKLKTEYEGFIKKQEFWLKDYAFFYTIKAIEDNKSWLDWSKEFRNRDKEALKKLEEEKKDEIDFVYFRQFKFQEQWDKLKKYANEKLVKIIGDVPFYLSLDSADVWANPEEFLVDENFVPTVVAGCPPDAFSATGQMWGNPIYDWKKKEKAGYKWWVSRIKRNYELYDVIRFDHFNGFASYYAVPYDAKDASKGTMEKGPGIKFFEILRKELGDDIEMIAEDLGEVTAENQKLLKDSKIPGMAVLQYAFTSWNSKYVTHRHEENLVVYTGTHDNTPSRAWVEEIGEGDRDFARRYINSRNSDFGGFVWDFIREAYHSTAKLCIIPLQDYLVKGRESRINSPGTMDGNWEWRLIPNFLSEDLARSIREMAETYGRIPVKPEVEKKDK